MNMHKLAIANNLNNSSNNSNSIQQQQQINGSGPIRPASVSLVSLPLGGGVGIVGNGSIGGGSASGSPVGGINSMGLIGGSKSVNTSPSNSSKSLLTRSICCFFNFSVVVVVI